MPELCTGFMVFAFAVAIVALVGHGIWTLGALLLRGASGRGGERGPGRQTCPRCGVHFSAAHSYCPSCNLNLRGALLLFGFGGLAGPHCFAHARAVARLELAGNRA